MRPDQSLSPNLIKPRDWWGPVGPYNATSIFGREVQAFFCRRRHQPSRLPLAKIRPGRPAPGQRTIAGRSPPPPRSRPRQRRVRWTFGGGGHDRAPTRLVNSRLVKQAQAGAFLSLKSIIL